MDPGGTAGCLVFGYFYSFQLALPILGYEVNAQLTAALPYLVALGATAVFAHRTSSREPWPNRSSRSEMNERARLSPPEGPVMKAMLFTEPGGTDVLRYEGVADPTPGPRDVVIRVAFTALNHLDIVQRNGWYQLPGFTYPHIAGMDVAGEVVSVGSDVTTVSVGDRVVVDPLLTDVPEVLDPGGPR